MRCAIVEDGVAVNVILADVPEDFGAIPCPDEVSVGWLYDGNTWTAPPKESEDDPI